MLVGPVDNLKSSSYLKCSPYTVDCSGGQLSVGKVLQYETVFNAIQVWGVVPEKPPYGSKSPAHIYSPASVVGLLNLIQSMNEPWV